MSPSDSPQPLSDIKERVLLDRKIRKVYDYWLAKHRGASLPNRSDIDPLELSDCLGVIMLLDLVGTAESRDFAVRLAGVQVEEAFGCAMRGHKLRELFKEAADGDCFRRLRMAAVTGEADFRSTDLSVLGRPFVRFDRVLLPLSDGSGAVAHLLCCYVFSIGAKPLDPARSSLL